MSETPAADLFGRYLDLKPLRRRRRGLVSCIFHSERSASLSIDLDRRVFHCFGCGVAGGYRRFAELVGEFGGETMTTTPPQVITPLKLGLALARRQPWARDEVRMVGEITRAIRRRRRAVDVARDAATRAGDCEAAWNLLARAAFMDTEAEAIEADLDETMR